jgi:hypothetical protein
MKNKAHISFRSFTFLFVILLSFSIPAYSQLNKDMADRLVLPLYKSAQNPSREQVYIQLSKGSYESGEDLWFKAYVLNVLSFAPSALSKTMYVRVIREGGGKPVWQERYEVVNGSVDGHVYLPDTLKEGFYLLEAFTMASFYKEGTEFKAFRRFRVVKDYKSLQVQGPNSNGATVKPGRPLQFGAYPEGGKLVTGVPGKLAFKAVNTDGMPVDVSGTLLEDGKVLQGFKSVHAGMGSLVFTPLAGKKYALQLKTPIDSTVQLPAPNTEGIGFRLSARDTGNLTFAITRPSGSPETRVYLRGQIRGKVCFLSGGVLNNELTLKMPLNSFKYQGIAEFTVFDDQFMPLAERLVYVHPEKKLYIKAELSKPDYGKREKAELHIKARDESGNPVQAELGISVYDKLYSTASEPNNLLSYSLLSTQLKGRIYDPAYYFEEKNKDREEAMDLLLLTQGWRNYAWSEDNLKAEGLKQAVVFDVTTGTVSFTKREKQTPPGQLVNLFLSDDRGKPKNSVMLIPDQAGRFGVSTALLKVGQGANIYLKPTGPEEYKPRIKLIDPFLKIDTLTKLKKYIFPYQGIIEKPIGEPNFPASMDSRIKRLKQVNIAAEGTRTFRDKYLGYLDSLAKLDGNTDYVGPCNILNCPIHAPERKIGKNTMPVEGKVYQQYVDFQWFNDGKSYTFGLIELITYKYPSFSEQELLKQFNISLLKGYYEKRECYQPDYDKEPNGDGSPDARNTLLWAPSVLTDEKGEARLTFFCSDINSGFVVQAEGITKSGLLGAQNLEFKVLKVTTHVAGK